MSSFDNVADGSLFMQIIEGGALFEIRFSLRKIRFSLRTVLYVVSAASVLFALCPLFATEIGFIAFLYAFMVFSLGVAAFAVWLATRNAPRYLGMLIACHLAIAMFLLIGPIVSYHLNGRAWYDYGLSPWNPPPYHFSDGTVGICDYDPERTRPAVWPVIGPMMYVMCWLSGFLMVLPPTAPIVSTSVFVLAIRLRHVLTTRQSLCVWTLWTIGSPPFLYMILWGGKVGEWIAD